MVYSKWVDNTDNFLEGLIDKFLINGEGTLDPFSNETLLHKVDLAFDDDQTFKIDEKVVTYNHLVYQYEYIRKNEITNPIRERRVGLYVADVIIFNYNFKNYYIVDKGCTTPTLGNLRTLAGYSDKMEISEQRIIGIKTDLFIWMIHHLLDNPNSFLNDQNNTEVESIIGFGGFVADKLAEISGSGEKIMKMLTTFLFLFENQKISKVEATVFRRDERFKLTLGEKSLVEIDFSSFGGEGFFVGKEKLKSKVAIKAFVGVIPNLISVFSDETNSKKWSTKREEKFFEDIGRDLSRKISEKLRTKNKWFLIVYLSDYPQILYSINIYFGPNWFKYHQ